MIDRTNLEVKTGSLKDGYEFFCDGCNLLFSVSLEKAASVKFCPVCGWDTLTHDRKEFEELYPFRAGTRDKELEALDVPTR
jgi:rRNA maturation endonuclease Nob1